MDEPRGESADDAQPWDEVTAGFVELATRIRSFFEESDDEETTGEVRSAWSDFTDAAGRLGMTVATAFQDEEVQAGAKRAFGSLVEAVGHTVRDTGDRFGSAADSSDEPAPDDGVEDDG